MERCAACAAVEHSLSLAKHAGPATVREARTHPEADSHQQQERHWVREQVVSQRARRQMAVSPHA